MTQILPVAMDISTPWECAAIASSIVAASSFAALVPMALTYVVLPELSWPATGSAAAAACFVVFGVIGISCAAVAW